MSSTCGALQQNLSQGWQRSSSCVARCAAVFGFYKYDNHPPPSLLTGTCPLWFFSLPQDEIVAQGVTLWQH